jgi:hypothetical protein
MRVRLILEAIDRRFATRSRRRAAHDAEGA